MTRSGTPAPGSQDDAGLTKAAARDVSVIAKGGAVQIAGQVTQRSLSFLFTFIAFRILDKVLYGVYRQVLQILSIAAQLGLAGYNYAAMRWITRARAANDPAGVRGAARVGLAGAAIGSGVVLVSLIAIAEPIASLFGDNEQQVAQLADLLRLGAVYVPLFAMLQVLRYCTQAYKTMVPSVIAGNIVQPGVRFVVGTAVLAAGYLWLGTAPDALLTATVITLVISVACGLAIAAVFFRRMQSPEERAATAVGRPGPMTRFALPQAGASLLGVQTLGLGIIVLGIFGESDEVGLFAVALSLQGPGTVFLGGIVNIWAPVVSDLHERGEIERLGSLYQTINRWIATFSFPVFAALLIMPELFVRLFAGAEGRGAAPIVAALAIGNFFYTGTGPTGYVISMTGRPGVNFVNSVVAVSLYLGLGAILVPRYGPVGMAAVDAAVTALVNSVRVIQAKVLVGVQPFGRTFYKPVLATAAGAALLLVWKLILGDAIPVEVAGIVVASAVYLVTLKLLGLDEEERLVFERIRKRALRARSNLKGNG